MKAYYHARARGYDPFADGSFERLLTSYFYCHLEEPERVRFLGEARRVGRQLVVIGSRAEDGEQTERWEERRLKYGSRWQVYKRVFAPEDLATELGGRILHSGRWFVAVAA